MMNIYSRIDQAALELDPRVVLKFTHHPPDLPSHQATDGFLLDDQTHLIWGERGWLPPIKGRPGRWVGGSLMEFPKAGLPWFIDSLENEFFKTSNEGGLPKGQFTLESEIDGEKLVIARMMGSPGYSLRNYSRHGHTLASRSGPQRMDLSDYMLFEEGLYDQLKALADKVRLG